MTNPTDPAAVEAAFAWGIAASKHVSMAGSTFSERQEAAAAVIQAYGDQREAAERERCASIVERDIKLGWEGYDLTGFERANHSLRCLAASIRDHLKGSGDDL